MRTVLEAAIAAVLLLLPRASPAVGAGDLSGTWKLDRERGREGRRFRRSPRPSDRRGRSEGRERPLRRRACLRPPDDRASRSGAPDHRRDRPGARPLHRRTEDRGRTFRRHHQNPRALEGGARRRRDHARARTEDHRDVRRGGRRLLADRDDANRGTRAGNRVPPRLRSGEVIPESGQRNREGDGPLLGLRRDIGSGHRLRFVEVPQCGNGGTTAHACGAGAP